MWFSSLLGIVDAVLQLKVLKEQRKYVDEKMAIEKEHYEESNKPDDVRDNAVLDNLGFRLRQLASAIAGDLAKPRS